MKIVDLIRIFLVLQQINSAYTLAPWIRVANYDGDRCQNDFQQNRPCMVIEGVSSLERANQPQHLDYCTDSGFHLPEVWSLLDVIYLSHNKKQTFFLASRFRDGQWYEPRLNNKVNDYLHSLHLSNPEQHQCLLFHPKGVIRYNIGDWTELFEPANCTEAKSQSNFCVTFVRPPPSQCNTVAWISLNSLLTVFSVTLLLWIFWEKIKNQSNRGASPLQADVDLKPLE